MVGCRAGWNLKLANSRPCGSELDDLHERDHIHATALGFCANAHDADPQDARRDAALRCPYCCRLAPGDICAHIASPLRSQSRYDCCACPILQRSNVRSASDTGKQYCWPPCTAASHASVSVMVSSSSLPDLLQQAPPTNLRKQVSLGDGVFVCGDWRDTATFDGERQ